MMGFLNIVWMMQLFLSQDAKIFFMAGNAMNVGMFSQ